MPYRIAVLCYVYDDDGRLLLLHRNKSPNAGMYSPVGGKLEAARGESPHAAAVREIGEETGLDLDVTDVRMAGIVAETAYEGETHWLIFLFEVTRAVQHDEIAAMSIAEGELEWVEADRVAELPIPETDREIMWPMVKRNRGGFFVVDIDCREGMRHEVREGV